MADVKDKKVKKARRHRKIRAKVFGTAKRPRLCVFRSSRHIYAQLVDDEKNKVLASASDTKLKAKKPTGKLSVKLSLAYETGKMIAKKALELGIQSIVFDRGGYKYHGRVKALARGAREQGLKF